MRWLFAAGGTGGHIFPALSIAMTLREKVDDVKILFVGTTRGMESRSIPSRGFALKTIRAHGFVGLSWRKRFRAILSLPVTIVQCLLVLVSFRPHLLLGMGGYVAGPMVLLAAMLGFKTAIAEQNAVAGRSNRVLGRFVRRVFVAFPESAVSFPSHKVRMTGNPVRPELLERARLVKPRRWSAHANVPFHLLVFGGSQGARNINLFMIEALPFLEDFPYPLQVRHQAGEKQVQELRNAYAAKGIVHRVVTFIERMDRAYGWAHLILCRAGATSLAEIALFQKPSILVPYPYAADDHQLHNARVFESAGAAVLLQEKGLTGELLAGTLMELARDPQRLPSMGEKAKAFSRPNAADLIVEGCLGLLRVEAPHG